MFNFFKKRNLVSDISWLGVDIHSHILPGIDDGAKDKAESLHFISKMATLGFEQLFFTPHIFTELYPNNPETILPVLDDVIQTLINDPSAPKLGAAAEYMVDYNFQVEEGLMCLPGKHILIEMSYLSETPNIETAIFNLQVNGYTIILAHPERYNFYHRETGRYTRLKEMGCLFQLNLLSVLGYYGKHVKQAADYLISQKLYDVAGSDLHHHKHLDILEREIRNGNLFNLVGNYEFQNKRLFAL